MGPFRRERNSPDLPKLAARQAEWVVKYSGSITYGELLTITKRHGLLTSMRYTKEFYTQKVRQLLGQPPLTRYSRRRSIFTDWFLVLLLRYLSCVTVVVEKHGRPAITDRAVGQSRRGVTT